MLALNDPNYVHPRIDDSRYKTLKVAFFDFLWWYRANQGALRDMDKATVRAIFDRMMLLLWERMIKDYYVLRLPFDLGSIYVRENAGGKPKVYKDWQASRKAGKLVRGYNFILDGAKPHIKWEKGSPGLCKYYVFKSVRGVKGEVWGYRGLWGYINSLTNKVYRPNIL